MMQRSPAPHASTPHPGRFYRNGDMMIHWPSCRALAFLAVFALVPFQGPIAGEGGSRQNTSPVRSSSQRFIVSGMSKEENVALAAALDDVAGKMEQLTGLRIPFDGFQILRVIVGSEPGRQGGRVVKAQGWVDGGLEQKLMVYNIQALSQEDVLEGFCWLLLNRYAIFRQPGKMRAEKLAACPEWLSTGIAQDLFNALKVRNMKRVLKDWQQDQSLRLSEILRYEFMPAGRWKEKAYASVVVAFLSSENAGFWNSCATQMARLLPISEEWLARDILGVTTVRDLEKNWDLWMSKQMQIMRDWGVVSTTLLSDLEDLLIVRPSQMNMPVDDAVPLELTLKDLISRRNESWVSPLSIRLNLQLKSLGIGQPPEFQQVLSLYEQFLANLAARPKNALMTFLRPPPSQKSLEQKLAKAEEARQELVKKVAERERYEADVEQELLLGQGKPEKESSPQQDEYRSYLDEVEKKMNQRDGASGKSPKAGRKDDP
ncbi:MAG: hypothetical protein V2A34_02100 [Lentisphaerota bacterium]